MRFGGIVLAAALLLGACSSDPAPKEPTGTPSTSSTPPARAVPTMPAQASEDSSEGAAAFVKHYVDVFNYAAATGDVDELSRLSSPDCEGCQSYIKLYKDTYEAGGYFKDSDWKIGDIKLASSDTEFRASTEVESGGGRFRTNKDAPEKVSAEDMTTLTFIVLRQPSSRQITRLALGDA
ncbi:DUF6318 family protein [Aeromicrobium wangtongii]|uniref:DUF6318 family protein n=1 Tax=Aeromicrobium wangtongii TaxID=2969247 RepID=A0ABY5M5G3_9ACTN|nr:DUF6318 family protein [Aeromicrobium wangtongii]MCD9198259.1 DUF6318 family protein [Aeromicrobium wangtongii]UUP12294.1 DUF6318 family protein [Aeromicrobium wangtongii]